MSFLMREASSKRVCQSVRHTSLLYKFVKRKKILGKKYTFEHSLSARHFYILCVELAVSENFGNSLSTRNAHLNF